MIPAQFCVPPGPPMTSNTMLRRRNRSGELLPTLGITLLAAHLLVVLGWAVVGKHRLDPHCTDVPAPFQPILPARVSSQELPPRTDALHSSRGPPVAWATAHFSSTSGRLVAPRVTNACARRRGSVISERAERAGG